MNETNEWTQRIQDVIASDEGLSEGLNDEEALPLIDWGRQQAEKLGSKLADPTDEKAAATGHVLARLMKRITWLAVYRQEKDANWLAQTISEINDLNRQLHGAEAPALTPEEVAGLVSHSDVVQKAMQRLTPTGETITTMLPSETAPTPLPGETAPGGAMPTTLPGREVPQPEETTPDVPPNETPGSSRPGGLLGAIQSIFSRDSGGNE